ncbi:4839_t:CDS:2 [Acaulospora morrowiae]|uniref:4839_t:CDS:1 n=1 Tax=Acaulospora morrowiae TaxID=94023 RepID=A0A9N8VID0_9GLOM|nr:4839_t:CDS:2 [Acaulospora morrowiae]
MLARPRTLSRNIHLYEYTFKKNSPSPAALLTSGTRKSIIFSNASLHTTNVQPSLIKRLASSLDSFKTFFLRGRNASVASTKKSDSTPKFAGRAETWDQAVSDAEKLIKHNGGSYIDPVKLVGKDLLNLTKNIEVLLGSGHPVLNTVSNYYFASEGKRIRPLIVLLMSQATSIAPKKCDAVHADFFQIMDQPLSSKALNKNISSFPTSDVDSTFYSPSLSPEGVIILPTQRRLAEITEMIHTASLLHDDVIDVSESRRNLPSANANYGNKMAILAGDFLLARASVALARLRNPEVIELLATVIANLVEGEFMQLQNIQENGTMSTFDYYMEKTYMKTASLIAKSCRAASVLGGATAEVCDIAYAYGRDLGLAFQLTDDMLDFIVTANDFGKPVGADLKLGLATAPVLYAWEEHPELGPLINRKFSQKGDVEKARELVYQSGGIEKTRILAASHCQRAIETISQLPESDARNALIQLTQKVLTRKK